jgi:hypothetical protein
MHSNKILRSKNQKGKTQKKEERQKKLKRKCKQNAKK